DARTEDWRGSWDHGGGRARIGRTAGQCRGVVDRSATRALGIRGQSGQSAGARQQFRSSVTARYSRRLVVVGGGLAGLAAAVEAGRGELETIVVEQRSRLRGTRRTLGEFETSGAEVWLDTAVWGLWGRDLALSGPDRQSRVLAFEHLIVATGGFE